MSIHTLINVPKTLEQFDLHLHSTTLQPLNVIKHKSNVNNKSLPQRELHAGPLNGHAYVYHRPRPPTLGTRCEIYPPPIMATSKQDTVSITKLTENPMSSACKYVNRFNDRAAVIAMQSKASDILASFLLLARYVPNVAKRSI